MLSRVADSIYWINRYIERAENVARFIQVNLGLMLDMVVDQAEQWEPLVTTSGDHEEFYKRYTTADKISVINFLTFDRKNTNSILSSVYYARENARSVREIIPSEMWEQINRFYLMVKDAAHHGIDASQQHKFYEKVKNSSHTIDGITSSTLSHGEGWHFARMGRLLERADKTSRILDVKYFILLPKVSDVGSPYDIRQWAAVLNSVSALEMYRQKYPRITPREVSEFLLMDREFPRAIHYCLIKGAQSLRAVMGTPLGSYQNAAEQRIGRLCSDFDYTSIEEIVDTGLHQYLDDFQIKLNQLGESIHDTFFSLETPESKSNKEKVNDFLHSYQS